jgi:hypothetical protein
MRFGAVMLLLCAASVAVAKDDVLSFHPAHWVEGDDLEPTFYISPLRALSFPSPGEGWIVGERYILHVRGDRLEVAFVELGESRNSVSFSNPASGWASSVHQEPWPMLSYRSGQWRGESLPGIGWPDWGISRVMAGPAGDAWAFAHFSEKVPGLLESPKTTAAILRYDGARWVVDQSLLASQPSWHLADACQSPDGQWWFVGVDTAAPSGRGKVLARWNGDTFRTIASAGTASERSGLYSIRCLSDGTIWASGDLRPAEGQGLEILLMRFTTVLDRVAVPVDLPQRGWASSLAPVSRDELWLSARCEGGGADCCERFLHYRQGAWETQGLPLLPGGRCTKVSIQDMQFVSPDEGWAVASDMEPGQGGGRIFHYKDGKWRNRNWNWHFWDAPWFNLFG